MSKRKSQASRFSRSSLSQSFNDDLEIGEHCLKEFTSLLYQRTTENNYELLTSCRRRQVKHVDTQTTPEIDERQYSWLLNIESKADALCVDMSNLLNTLLQAKNWDTKRKRFDQNPLSLDFILSKTAGDEMKRIIKPEPDLPGFSTCSSFTGAPNLSITLMIQNIENKIKTVLKRATELRNSIPIVSPENVKETSDKSVQTVFSELNSNMEKKRSELNRENYIRAKVPNQNRTKNNTLCTEKTVTFKLQRSTTQVPFVSSRNTSTLKKQVSSLNSDWKKKDFTIAKSSSNFSVKKVPSNENIAPDKDMRATGAISKKTKDLNRKVPVVTHRKTDRQVTEYSKTKQVPLQKPVWR